MKEEKISCKHCGSYNVVRKGKRKLAGNKNNNNNNNGNKNNNNVNKSSSMNMNRRQIYFCKDCLHRFSLGLNKKRFDVWLIVNAVSFYNKGYSYEEACDFISRKHKISVGKSSVERWAKEYYLGFLDIRERIISKYGRDCVIEKAFNHSGLIYNFKMHKGKLKEFGKFIGLKDFIFSITKGVDERFFNGERCSQSSECISCKVDVSENLRLNKVIGEMLKIVKSNKQRHGLVEELMLHCDRDTVAVEVPVWYWDKINDRGICGHIDIIQVKFGKIWIMDYKPDSEKENFERVMSQLYNYALALSFRTGVSLSNIKCAWFDASRIYSFEPSRVVIGKPLKFPLTPIQHTVNPIGQFKKDETENEIEEDETEVETKVETEVEMKEDEMKENETEVETEVEMKENETEVETEVEIKEDETENEIEEDETEVEMKENETENEIEENETEVEMNNQINLKGDDNLMLSIDNRI